MGFCMGSFFFSFSFNDRMDGETKMKFLRFFELHVALFAQTSRYRRKDEQPLWRGFTDMGHYCMAYLRS